MAELPHHITDTNASTYAEIKKLSKIELTVKLAIALHEIACLMQRCDHLARSESSDIDELESIDEHSSQQIDQSREAMEDAIDFYNNNQAEVPIKYEGD